jgi:hypothetical protein
MDSELEIFSERALSVLSLAHEEARRLKHDYISTEHFLLGLLRENQGVAVRVLVSLGVDLNKVRASVEFTISKRPSPGETEVDSRLRALVQLSFDEACRMNRTYIGTEHLLIGLLREGDGVAAGVFEHIGITMDKVRTETHRILTQNSNTKRTFRLSLDDVKTSFADALWPLMPWLAGKLLYIDPYIDPSGLAAIIKHSPLLQLWREWVWWYYCLDHSKKIVYPHTVYALSPSWCRKARRLLKKQLQTELRAAMLRPDVKAGLTELRRQVQHLRLLQVLTMRLGMLLEGSVAPSSPSQEFGEWTHRLEEAFYRPEKAVTLVPPDALVGHKEGAKLLKEIGPEGYGAELQSLMWQAVFRPGSLERAPLRDNHPIWKKLGVNPKLGSSPEQAVVLGLSSAVRLFNSIKFQDVLRFGLGGTLRHQHGLARERDTKNFSELEAEGDIRQGQSSQGGVAYRFDREDPSAELEFGGIIEQMTMNHILGEITAILTPTEFQVLQIQMECDAHGDFKQMVEAAGMKYDSARVLLNRARKKLAPLFSST